jgi:phosphoglycolate phosphatase
MDRKAELFREHTAQHRPPLFGGIVEFVKAARPDFRLAIASGGRCEQIRRALERTPIERDFEVIVSADDCVVGKPDPAIYLLTLQRLNAQRLHRPLLSTSDCLVIEDSKAGIQAGRAAGMTVLALATTYADEQLTEAALVLPGLQGISPLLLLKQLWEASNGIRS